MKLLRKLLPKALQAIAFDTIKHHHTKDKFRQNTYSYLGGNREADAARIFNSWIKPGDFVLEIDGHISITKEKNTKHIFQIQ